MKCIIYFKVITATWKYSVQMCCRKMNIFKVRVVFTLFCVFNINSPWMSLIVFLNPKSTMINPNIFLFHRNAFIWLSCHRDTGQLWHSYLDSLMPYDINYLLNFKYEAKKSCHRNISYCPLIRGWWFSWTGGPSKFCEFQIPWDRRLCCLKWKIVWWNTAPLGMLQTARI